MLLCTLRESRTFGHGGRSDIQGGGWAGLGKTRTLTDLTSKRNLGVARRSSRRASSGGHRIIITEKTCMRDLQRMPISMALAEHTTKAFDCDLQDLARMIAEMGGLAERQIVEAIEALSKRN